MATFMRKAHQRIDRTGKVTQVKAAQVKYDPAAAARGISSDNHGVVLVLPRVESEWDDMAPGDDTMYSEEDHGDMFIDTVEVHRDDEGSLSAVATVHTSLLDCYSDLDEDAAEAQLNKHQKAITDWLRATYDATDGGSEWADVAIEFSVSDSDSGSSFPSDLSDVVDLLNERTKLVALDNDMNGGYRSNGRMYGFHDSLRNHLDELDEAEVN